MPSVGSIASAVAPTAAAIGTGAAVGTGTLLGLSAGPAGAVVGAGVGALMALIGQIGAGRRTANRMTQGGGPQDILNKQLAAIVNDPGSDATAKAQATDQAYQQFLQSANQFASTNGGKAPLVVQQAIYKTPGLQSTLNSLLAPLGKTAWDQGYTSMVPGITATTLRPGAGQGPNPSLTTGLINAGIGAAAGYGAGQLFGGGSTVGNVSAGTPAPGDPAFVGPIDPGTAGNSTVFGGYDTEGNPIWTPTQNPNYGGSQPGDPGTKVGPPGPNNTFGQGGSLLSRILPNLISAGTSLAGGLIGSNAANNAAQVQAQAANNAAQLQYQTGQNALQFQRDVLAQQQANLQPWLNAGQGALKSIADINANPYQLPTAEQALQSPGLQFQMQQGQAALEAFERAHGTLLSGGAQKSLNQFAQGTALQSYGNLVNEQLAARSANLNPLLAVAGLGQTSTGQVNTALGNAANLGTQTQLQTSQNIGNLGQEAAAATASGYGGSASSWLNSLQNIGNIFTQQQSIAQFMKMLQAQKTATA